VLLVLVQDFLLVLLSPARWDRRLFWRRALRVLRRVLLGQRLPLQDPLRLLSLLLLLPRAFWVRVVLR
jgi:hypothetical protein